MAPEVAAGTDGGPALAPGLPGRSVLGPDVLLEIPRRFRGAPNHLSVRALTR
jgi:hypothetical protein